MKTRKIIRILCVMLVSMACVSCNWLSNSDDPLIAMKALADEAERDAKNWSVSELKEKQDRTVEILSTFNEKKKDYDKDDFREILKDLKRFAKAIDKTPADKELRRSGYYDEEKASKEKASKISKELIDYFGKVDM